MSSVARKVMIGAVLSLLILVVAVPRYVYHNRVSEADVRSQLAAAGIVGLGPENVATRLASLPPFADSRMAVGEYDPATRTLYGSIDNARRLGPYTWRIVVTVRFDSTGSAASFETKYSAVRPL